MNRNIIAKALGALLFLMALLAILPAIIAISYGEALMPWIATIIGGCAIGAGLWGIGFKSRTIDMGIKEGMAVTTLAWFFGSLLAAISFYIGVKDISWMQAWFEAMSGLTTTGATVFGGWVDPTSGAIRGSAIENLDHGLLLWRSLLQWIGGIGIVVISIALIPLLVGGSGFQMYRAEVPGVSADRVAPRISSTARILLGFYVGLTISGVFILSFLCDVPLFHAFCHACTTVATGGFSTFDTSAEGLQSRSAEWAMIGGMYLGGLNFSLLIAAIRGKPGRLWLSIECRVYTLLFIGASCSLALILHLSRPEYSSLHDLVRDSLFQSISIMTSSGFGTGFDTVDGGSDGWPLTARMILIILMIGGGCAGSTAGGIKLIRLIIAWYATRRELRRSMEPARLCPVIIDKMNIPDRTIMQVMGFLSIYFMSWLFGTTLLIVLGNNFEVAASASLSALSNIGPASGEIGASGNFGHLSDSSLFTILMLMLLGRLEFFGVLMALYPAHWKK